jgi:hypothetical protein
MKNRRIKNLVELAIRVRQAEERVYDNQIRDDIRVLKDLVILFQDIRIYEQLKNKAK